MVDTFGGWDTIATKSDDEDKQSEDVAVEIDVDDNGYETDDMAGRATDEIGYESYGSEGAYSDVPASTFPFPNMLDGDTRKSVGLGIEGMEMQHDSESDDLGSGSEVVGDRNDTMTMFELELAGIMDVRNTNPDRAFSQDRIGDKELVSRPPTPPQIPLAIKHDPGLTEEHDSKTSSDISDHDDSPGQNQDEGDDEHEDTNLTDMIVAAPGRPLGHAMGWQQDRGWLIAVALIAYLAGHFPW
jgi:hypothetical protein